MMYNMTDEEKEEYQKEKATKEAVMLRYPLLYSNRRNPKNNHCMNYGLSIGIGWVPMIEEYSKKIETYLVEFVKNNPGKDFPRVTQVKEKFGGLRFYMSQRDDVVDEIVAEMEEKSYTTCETCGSTDASKRTEGWHKVLCNSCHEKRRKRS